MTAKLTAGGEVISYCTKCRMDLAHRIIALVEGVPVKVECQTCGSHHKYRRPKEEVEADKHKRAAARSAARAKTSSRSQTAVTRANAKPSDEIAWEKQWQQRIAGQLASSFQKYSPQSSFEQDALIHHAKFGDGYVVQVIDTHKMEVMFQDGPRILAQGLQPFA